MFATVNGVRLHYTVEGAGLPLLVISIAGTPIYQRTFSPALRDHFQMIFLDLRGSGPSETGVIADVTLDTLLEDMDGVRAALGLERVTVLGHSLHGWLALAYAATYPEHAAGAVVVGTPPRADADVGAVGAAYWETMASSERKALLAERLAALDESELAELSPDQAFIRWYLATGPQRFRDPAFDWAFFWDGCSFSMDVFNRVGALLDGYDPTPSFPSIRCPVFLALGVHDYPIPPILWHPAKDLLPDATYHAFEHSGHWPFYEEQERFGYTLIEWAAARLPRGAAPHAAAVATGSTG